jgi:hypothetical protein
MLSSSVPMLLGSAKIVTKHAGVSCARCCPAMSWTCPCDAVALHAAASCSAGCAATAQGLQSVSRWRHNLGFGPASILYTERPLLLWLLVKHVCARGVRASGAAVASITYPYKGGAPACLATGNATYTAATRAVAGAIADHTSSTSYVEAWRPCRPRASTCNAPGLTVAGHQQQQPHSSSAAPTADPWWRAAGLPLLPTSRRIQPCAYEQHAAPCWWHCAQAEPLARRCTHCGSARHDGAPGLMASEYAWSGGQRAAGERRAGAATVYAMRGAA